MGLETVKKMIAVDHEKAFLEKDLHDSNFANDIIYTNIEVLDRGLDGIYKNDFIVLSAKTGSGKTEMLCYIAMNVALQEKIVDFFALESDRYEIHHRIEFRLYAKAYFEDTKQLDIDFGSYRKGKLKEKLSKYKSHVEAQTAKIAKYLRVHWRYSYFDDKDFIKMFNYCAGKNSSLVLCDHAQFFDFDDNKSSVDHIKNLAQEMLDLINSLNVPLVLVSHLRKLNDNKNLPDIDDIFGSSELVKKAKKVLIICRGERYEKTNSYETIFRFEKNRFLSPSCYRTYFNIGTRSYSNKTIVEGRIYKDKFVPFEKESQNES